MIKYFQTAPSVEVTVQQDMLFVCPTVDASFPSEDPEVRGTVLLRLPTKRSLQVIRVALHGICDAKGGNGYEYETTTTLEKHLDLDLNGEILEPGDHAFDFSFIIPSSTAVHQRSAFGHVRHYVKAKVEFASAFSTSIASKSVALWIFATESRMHDIPGALEVNMEHFNEDLGPISIGISSPHLTVSSLVNYRLAFIAPSVTSTLHSINAYVQQAFEIHYTNGTIVKPAPKKFNLINLNKTSLPPPSSLSEAAAEESISVSNSKLRALLVQLYPGTEWKFTKTGRVPDGDYVRPTTLEGTQTCIRVSHQLVIDVRYTVNGEKYEKSFSVSRPVIVASCCCMVDGRFLPAYVRKGPATVIRPITSRCLCNLSLKEMVDRDGLALEQAGSFQTSAFQERLLGVDRSDKTPSYQSGP